MGHNYTKIGLFKIATDLLFILLSFNLAQYFSGKTFFEESLIIHLIMQICAWIFLANVTHYYDDFRTEKYFLELFLIFQNTAILLFLCSQLFFLLNDNAFSRTFLLYYALLLLPSILIKNYVTKKILIKFRQLGINIRNVILIGDNKVSDDLKNKIANSSQFGLSIVDVVDFEMASKTDSVKTLLNKYKQIHEVIITETNLSNETFFDFIEYCEANGIRLKHIPSFFNLYFSKDQLSVLGDYPILTHRPEPLQQEFWVTIKRGFDILGSLLFLVFIAIWLFPIIAILLKLDSEGPVFFLQKRWGKDNKGFNCLKFRTMTNAASIRSEKNFIQTVENDSRITRLGSFLRKSSIDELPQFFNILIGEMSIIGPRPHAHEHNLREKDKIKKYQIRHWVKPGLTGYAQVNGLRGETKTKEEMQKRIEFDIYYIENWTLFLDVKILSLTIYNVIQGKLSGV